MGKGWRDELELEIMGLWDYEKGASVPRGIALGDEHARVADGEDMYFVVYRFVHDAVGAAKRLAESVYVFRDCLETYGWNGGAEVWEVGNWCDCTTHAVIPSDGICGRKLVVNLRQYFILQTSGMRRPENGHRAAFLLSSLNQRSSIARVSRSICSCGIPLPSANSRREISMSRERSRISFLVGKSMGTTSGAAKPRCSSVCMRRTFMAVEVVMPRRSKSWSARFLISGFTRNAIVAEFVDINILLFNRCEHCSTKHVQMQACGWVFVSRVEHVERVERDFGRVEVKKWRSGGVKVSRVERVERWDYKEVA